MTEADDNIEKFYRDGRLDCTKPKNGTGVMQTFQPNGHLSQEVWMQNGQVVGWCKLYDTDGTLLMTKFMYRFKVMSKKQYLKLCDKNPEMPRFDDVKAHSFITAADLKLERQVQKNKAQARLKEDKSESRKKHEEFCQQRLAEGNPREVVEWLSGEPKGQNTLGELTTNQESLKLARKLYSIGAVKVFAIEIGKNEQGENSGKLVIVLPSDPEARKRIFRWSNKLAREQGFDPDVDIGQEHLFVMLD